MKSAVQQFEPMLANNSDAKPFWLYVKFKSKTRMCIGPLQNSTGELTDNDQECAEILSDAFSSVYTNEDLKVISFAPPKTKDELVDMIFTEEIVARNLAKMKNYSSSGPDNIPYIVLKAGRSIMVKVLCQLFQLIFDYSAVPSVWKTAHVTPVYKKGNKRDPLNYRPISLTSYVCKIMESSTKEVMWNFWLE